MLAGLAYVVTAVAVGGSFTGYLTLLHRRNRVDPAFLPATICAGTGVIVLIGGLLGALAATAILLLLLGSLALGQALWRHPEAVRRALLEPATLTFALLSAGIAVVLHGRRFTQYDDFSHWALIVKVLLATDELPDRGDPVVAFRSYIPGSASFIYAVCRFLGPREGEVMLAQGILIVAGCVALVAIPVRRRWLGPPLALAALVVAGGTGIALDSLLVDTLLAVYLVVPLLLAARHAAALRPTWPAATVLLAFLTAIKTSGILLAALAAAALLVTSLLRRGRLRWRVVPLLGGPAVLAYVWTRHVRTTFPDGAGRYALPEDPAAIPVKTPAERTEIIGAYLEYVRSEPRLVLAATLLIPALLALVAAGAIRRRSAVLLGAGSALGMLGWLSAVLTLYLTAMPLVEARRLAGVRRYVGTGSTLAILLLLVAAGVVLDRGRGLLRLAAAAGALVLVLPWLPATGYLVRHQQLQDTTRGNADLALTRAPSIPPGAPVCVIEDRRDAGYRRFMLRYLLASDTVAERFVTPERSAPAVLRGCSYAVLLAPNPAAQEVLRRDGFTPVTDPPVVAKSP